MSAWVRLAGQSGVDTIFGGSYAAWNWFYINYNLKRIGLSTHSYAPADFVFYSSYTFSPNTWYQVAVVYDFPGNVSKLYVNGNVVATKTGLIALPDNPSCITGLGAHGVNPRTNNYFKGSIDEAAIWNRALSDAEISNIYKRGALRLKFQVRSCDDEVCNGENFIGPDGTNSTYYFDNNAGLPNMVLSNVVNSQYFQYKAILETNDNSLTPRFSRVEATTQGNGSAEMTQSACLDLSSDLSKYLPSIPFDSQTGSLDKTYYALRKVNNKTLQAVACSSEAKEVKVVK